MVYFQYLLSITKTEKLTKNEMKKFPQAQMELKDYKNFILPAPFILGRC